ncbi:MAG: amino acid transporter substrate-binding protein [Oscillospiraceae bacterium]|nr:amino acid transporter substrate-binding protein [Oscillospiraceae bacterium]
MKNRERLISLSMAVLLGLGLVGCGDQSASSSDTSTGGTAASSDSGSEVTTIICALDANVAPYTYLDEDGNITGYDYETLKLIDELLPDYTFEYQMVDYDAAAIGLEAGQYDLEAGSKYKTSARAEKFLICDSNYYAAVTLAVAADSGINSIEDMKGKTLVPVPEADGLRQVYLDYMEANPDADITQETGSSLISISDGLSYVASGRYDGMIDPPDMFNDVLSQDADLAAKIKVIEDPFTVVGGHFLLNKSRTDLEEQINTALQQIKEDGTLGALSEKWFGEDLIAKYSSIALD